MLAGRRFGGSNPFGIELFVLVSDPRFKNLGLIDQTPLALCWRQRNTPHDDRGCVPPDQAQGPRGLLLALTRCFLVQHLRRSNGATQTSSSDTRLLHRIARWSFLRCRVGSSNSHFAELIRFYGLQISVTPILESVPRSGKRNQQHSFAELTYLEGFSVEDLLCLRHPDSRIWVTRLRDLLATAHASGTRLLLGNEFDNLGFAAYWLVTLSLLNQRLFQATKLTLRPWPL